MENEKLQEENTPPQREKVGEAKECERRMETERGTEARRVERAWAITTGRGSWGERQKSKRWTPDRARQRGG